MTTTTSTNQYKYWYKKRTRIIVNLVIEAAFILQYFISAFISKMYSIVCLVLLTTSMVYGKTVSNYDISINNLISQILVLLLIEIHQLIDVSRNIVFH